MNHRRRNRFQNVKLCFMLALVLICNFSIGFSSWVVSDGGTHDATDSINIDFGKVENFSNIFSINTDAPSNGYEPLCFNSNGFINSETNSSNTNNTSTKGSFKIYFNMNVGNAIEQFGNFKQIIVIAHLDIDKLSAIFNGIKFTACNLTVFSQQYSSEVTRNSNQTETNFQLTIDSTLYSNKTIEFNVEYQIMPTAFQNIYNRLLNEQFYFYVTLEVLS